MTKARAEFRFRDALHDRTIDGSSESAVLITDKVYPAADVDQAYQSWLTLAEWLRDKMEPSQRWQLVLRTLHAARGVESQDKANSRDLSSGSAMLNLVGEVLGADAKERVRQAAANRMLGRG